MGFICVNVIYKTPAGAKSDRCVRRIINPTKKAMQSICQLTCAAYCKERNYNGISLHYLDRNGEKGDISKWLKSSH